MTYLSRLEFRVSASHYTVEEGMAEFRLMETETAEGRIDELCRVVEYWLGPRKTEYGIPEKELAKYELAAPLRKLYAFAGRWPGNFLSVQDELIFPENSVRSKGRMTFATENQCTWVASTLPAGNDPPVWLSGISETACNPTIHSLSNFLVMHVLQALCFSAEDGGELDEKLLFADEIETTTLWSSGSHPAGCSIDFYLWRGVLIEKLGDNYFAGANQPDSILAMNRVLV